MSDYRARDRHGDYWTNDRYAPYTPAQRRRRALVTVLALVAILAAGIVGLYLGWTSS